MVEKLDTKSFKERVIVNRENCVVKFYSVMCPLCINLAPIYEEISNEIGDKIKFYKVDADEETKMSKTLKFDGVPTIMLFYNGSLEEVPFPYNNPDGLTGYRRDDIINFINNKVQ